MRVQKVAFFSKLTDLSQIRCQRLSPLNEMMCMRFVRLLKSLDPPPSIVVISPLVEFSGIRQYHRDIEHNKGEFVEDRIC